MKYVFIINPAAGRDEQYRRLLPSIEHYFSAHPSDYTIEYTKGPGDAREKAAALAKTGEEMMLFACGGEGTAFEILNGIVGHEQITMTTVPSGSANDFLKSFDKKYKESFWDVESLVNGQTVRMDLIKADEFYCLNGCSVGMDAVVAKNMSLFKRWPLVSGSMAYKLAIVKTFFQKIGADLTLTIDGVQKETKNCLFAVVGNGPAYGGGYFATPDALPYDGTLDYTIVETISKLKIIRFLGEYEKGRHEKFDYCELGRMQTMSFSCNHPVPINLDGEILERDSMSFSIVKNALPFRVPQVVYDEMKILAKS